MRNHFLRNELDIIYLRPLFKQTNMKIVLLLITTISLSIQGIGQLTEGNWLVGGNASFEKTKNFDGQSYVYKYRSLELNAGTGYFFIDKLAAGMKLEVALNNMKVLEDPFVSESGTQLGLGPFIRYYFLPYDNRINLFSEGHFLYTTTIMRRAGSKESFDHNRFGGSIGAVAFFNSSVGIEMMVTYNRYNSTAVYNRSHFQYKMGFQIHLEKNED